MILLDALPCRSGCFFLKLLEIRSRDLNRVLPASQRFKDPIAGLHIVEVYLNTLQLRFALRPQLSNQWITLCKEVASTIKMKTTSSNRRYFSIFIGNLPSTGANYVAGRENSNLSRQHVWATHYHSGYRAFL